MNRGAEAEIIDVFAEKHGIGQSEAEAFVKHPSGRLLQIPYSMWRISSETNCRSVCGASHNLYLIVWVFKRDKLLVNLIVLFR